MLQVRPKPDPDPDMNPKPDPDPDMNPKPGDSFGANIWRYTWRTTSRSRFLMRSNSMGFLMCITSHSHLDRKHTLNCHDGSSREKGGNAIEREDRGSMPRRRISTLMCLSHRTYAPGASEAGPGSGYESEAGPGSGYESEAG
jgi:hypothetical protein